MKEVKKAKIEQYETVPVFEQAMQSIAKSFVAVQTQAKRNAEMILREIRVNHEDHQHFRSAVRMHDREIILHDRKIGGLVDRVEALEK